MYTNVLAINHKILLFVTVTLVPLPQ